MSAAVFDIEYIVLELGSYRMSLIELLGTLTGLVSVWLAAKTHLLTWPSGIVNAVLLFVFFYQLRLYSDMFLQVYFFFTCIYGWWKWKDKSAKNSDREIGWMSLRGNFAWFLVVLGGSALMGWCMLHIHEWLPVQFPQAAAYPFADSVIAVMSVCAMLLMARKKTESWILWVLVDLLAIIVYSGKEVYVIAGEYVIFLAMAAYGLWQWSKKAAANKTR